MAAMIAHTMFFRSGPRLRAVLIEIRDPKVVVAYAVQAVSIFDHYGFRNRMKKAEKNPKARDLSEPPAAGKPAWWEPSFTPGEYKCRDRELFSSL